MEQALGVDELLLKIEKLKLSARVDSQTIPILDDLFQFVKDIIPLMLEINAFMREGKNKVPTATENLTNVSRTTEMATQEVMDHLEHIIEELEMVKTTLLNQSAVKPIAQKIQAIQNEAQDIFYSFQFQDITTQQLEYVNRILKAIYSKFLYFFQSSLRIKGNSILGQDVIDAIEKELSKGEINAFSEHTEDTVRTSQVSQEHIDKYFK